MPQHFFAQGLVTALHDLAAVVWVGGLVALGLVVLPAVKVTLGRGPQGLAVIDAVQKRLHPLVWVSMAVVIVTGLLQARSTQLFAGLFSTANPYSSLLTAKHVLVLLMIATGLYRSLALVRGKDRSPGRVRMATLLLAVNVCLGISVLVLSGFLAALP